MLNAPLWQLAAMRLAWRRLRAVLAHRTRNPGYETLRGW